MAILSAQRTSAQANPQTVASPADPQEASLVLEGLQRKIPTLQEDPADLASRDVVQETPNVGGPNLAALAIATGILLGAALLGHRLFGPGDDSGPHIDYT